MRTRLSALVVGIAFAVVVAGYAASMTVSARQLAAGSAAVSACDANGFTFRYTIDATGRITTVGVTGIAGACAGGTLRLTLAQNGTALGSGAANLPSAGFGGTATISIAPTALSSEVTTTYAAVEGP